MQFFERKIPQWYENKYIKLLPLKKTLLLYLLRKTPFLYATSVRYNAKDYFLNLK